MAKVILHWGSLAIAVSLFLMAVQTFLPFIPFFIITGANVLIFGFWRGTALNYVGAFLGDSVAYWVAREYGQTWFRKFVPESVVNRWVKYFYRRRGFMIVVISRLVPVVPAGLVNLSAGLANMEYGPFALGTLIGNVPASILNGLLGHDIFTFGQNKVHLLEIIGILAILSALGELWLRLTPEDPPKADAGPPSPGEAKGRLPVGPPPISPVRTDEHERHHMSRRR